MSEDPRWAKLAEHIAVATEVRKGSRVAIMASGESTQDAVRALVAEVYRRGAVPQVLLADPRHQDLALALASDEVLAEPHALEAEAIRWADIYVAFRGMVPPGPIPANAHRLALLRAAHGTVSTLRWELTRWCLVRVPTPDWAVTAGQDYSVLMEEFFAGCLADWSGQRAVWEQWATRLSATRHLRVVAPGTDLSLRVNGRPWVVFAGEENLPDGEIATAPIETSAEGRLAVPGCFWFAGQEIRDLVLTFHQGLLVDLVAAKGEHFARALCATDAGASRIGEFGIGVSPTVRTMTGDLLIDEKIMGTVHIALGRAYTECGGTNRSVVHWDIVKDLRSPESHLVADDHWAVIEAGRLVLQGDT